jgi:hypothetical protein
MVFAHGAQQRLLVMEKRPEQDKETNSPVEDAVSLHRWLVSFASGPRWYSVGEFVALDGQAAIDRAIDIFGSASDYRAEEIPWDAAPLPRPMPGAKKY